MTFIRRSTRIVAALIFAAALGGCAANPKNPADPLEPMNRAIYSFNETLDKVTLKPIAQGYNFIVPENVRNAIHNAFQNILEPLVIVNQLLQGKLKAAAEETFRFVVNSTFGFGGVGDLATEMGFPRAKEDFGQTFGVWGIKSGPYLVLPILGPSSFRDAVGLALDFIALDAYFTIDYVPVRNITIGAWVVDTRAHLLETEDILNEAAVDKYAFVRDSFLQRRESLIYDGSPPRQKLEDDENSSQPAGDKRSEATDDAPASGAAAEAPPEAALQEPVAAEEAAPPAAEVPAAAAAEAPKPQPEAVTEPAAVPVSDAAGDASGGLPPLAAAPAAEPTAPQGALMRVWLPSGGLTH